MARELRWWIVAVVIACGGVALAYLPPRGGVRPPRHYDPFGNGSPARRRAQELASKWRTVDMQIGVLQVRPEVQSELARRAAAGVMGPALLFEASGPIPEAAHGQLAAALDSVWRDLGLRATKISVGVVVQGTRVASSAGETPGRATIASARVLPNAADPTTCVVLLRIDSRYAPLMLGRAGGPQGPTPLKNRLKSALGPCAFYAAFGVPGRPVRQWLGRRGYDLALYPDWDEVGGVSDWYYWLRDPNTKAWRWSWFYGSFPWSLSATTLGCLGGRARQCRDAVLEGAEYSSQEADSQFVVAPDCSWCQRRLFNGQRYLSDVAQEVGPERFLQFWTSGDPVDTTLAAALKAPVGKWTERWQRRFVPRLPLGAAAPLGASVLGCLFAAAAVAITAVSARRRQAR